MLARSVPFSASEVKMNIPLDHLIEKSLLMNTHVSSYFAKFLPIELKIHPIPVVFDHINSCFGRNDYFNQL